MESGIEIEGTEYSITLKEYADGKTTGKVTINPEEFEETIEILNEFKIKNYRHQWYLEHKAHCAKQNREWCRNNPKKVSAIQKRWRDKNPNYYKNYMRRRKAATEPLIFQFLDNGSDGDVGSFVSYLREVGTPEQHIRWFQVDVKKIIEKREKSRTPP